MGCNSKHWDSNASPCANPVKSGLNWGLNLRPYETNSTALPVSFNNRVRNEELANFVPQIWELGPCDMESMYLDYYHDRATKSLEMTAFQARNNQFNEIKDPLNDGSDLQHETDPQQILIGLTILAQSDQKNCGQKLN